MIWLVLGSTTIEHGDCHIGVEYDMQNPLVQSVQDFWTVHVIQYEGRIWQDKIGLMVVELKLNTIDVTG